MKFEENIKEKFSDRRIDPSPGAWDRVAAQLQREDRRKKGHYWSQLAVAAGLASLFLLGSLFFFEQDQKDRKSSPIVEVPKKSNSGGNNEVVTAKSIKNKNPDATTTEKNQLEIPQNREKYSSIMRSKPRETDLKEEGYRKVVSPATRTKVMKPEMETAIDTAINSLLASVTKAEQNGVQVSDATIDSLLERARLKLFNNPVYTAPDKNLSATALLEDVEVELDQSFRDRVFELLKEGLIKAREAIASRND